MGRGRLYQAIRNKAIELKNFGEDSRELET